MTCPNNESHITRREPTGNERGQPARQIYCTVCAEFFDTCPIQLGPMEVCVLTKDHGNVHIDSRGNAHVLNLQGVSQLSVTRN